MRIPITGAVRDGAAAIPAMLPDPRRNRLLAALPLAEWQLLRPQLEYLRLAPGQVLYESGRPQDYVFFPVTTVVSLLYVMQDGASAEIAVTGNEGFVGVALVMGGESTPSRALVQGAGHGYRLAAPFLQTALAHPPVLQLLLRFVQALVTQVTQNAACNRHHRLEQQLCRRLLLSLDRSEGNEIAMTQESMAAMLGVRREGVTGSAHRLQQDRLICYARGHITVLDRAGLEQRSCECYAVVRKEYERLLPGVLGSSPH